MTLDTHLRPLLPGAPCAEDFRKTHAIKVKNNYWAVSRGYALKILVSPALWNMAGATPNLAPARSTTRFTKLLEYSALTGRPGTRIANSDCHVLYMSPSSSRPLE